MLCPTDNSFTVVASYHTRFYIHSSQVCPTSVLCTLMILDTTPKAIRNLKKYLWIEKQKSKNNMPVNGPQFQMMLKPLGPNHLAPKPAYLISTGLCQGMNVTKRGPMCGLFAVQNYLPTVGAIFWLAASKDILAVNSITTWHNTDLKGSLVWKPGACQTKKTHQYKKLATTII